MRRNDSLFSGASVAAEWPISFSSAHWADEKRPKFRRSLPRAPFRADVGIGMPLHPLRVSVHSAIKCPSSSSSSSSSYMRKS